MVMSDDGSAVDISAVDTVCTGSLGLITAHTWPVQMSNVYCCTQTSLPSVFLILSLLLSSSLQLSSSYPLSVLSVTDLVIPLSTAGSPVLLGGPDMSYEFDGHC
jgi:hypothetical protein